MKNFDRSNIYFIFNAFNASYCMICNAFNAYWQHVVNFSGCKKSFLLRFCYIIVFLYYFINAGYRSWIRRRAFRWYFTSSHKRTGENPTRRFKKYFLILLMSNIRYKGKCFFHLSNLFIAFIVKGKSICFNTFFKYVYESLELNIIFKKFHGTKPPEIFYFYIGNTVKGNLSRRFGCIS